MKDNDKDAEVERLQEREIEKLKQTISEPIEDALRAMVMDAHHPLEMAKEVVEYVTARRWIPENYRGHKDMTNDELKPCPFCGGTSVILDEPIHEDSYAVICNTKCGAIGPEDEDGEKAIEFWNTRPLEDALLKRVKELEDLAKAQSQ